MNLSNEKLSLSLGPALSSLIFQGSIKFQWTPESGAKDGTISFHVTVVEKLDTFWVNHATRTTFKSKNSSGEKRTFVCIGRKLKKKCYFRCQWRVWGSDGGKACCTFLENHHRRTFGKDAMSENLEYT